MGVTPRSGRTASSGQGSRRRSAPAPRGRRRPIPARSMSRGRSDRQSVSMWVRVRILADEHESHSRSSAFLRKLRILPILIPAPTAVKGNLGGGWIAFLTADATDPGAILNDPILIGTLDP